MTKEKKTKIFAYIMIGLLLLVFIVNVCPPFLLNDTLYDIKVGERYFNTGVFHIDNYSIHSDLIYQTHHYLVSIVTYLVYTIFSFPGLYALEVLLTSLIMFLFYKLDKTMIKNKFLLFILLFIQIIALSPFISLRAQMYSYIIFMMEIFFIEKFLNSNDNKAVFLLTLLPLLLINVHSGVIYFYFIILFTYMLGSIKLKFMRITNDKRITKDKIKKLLLVSLIGGVLTLINPYGIDGLTYGIKTLGSYYISNYITEFQSFILLSPMGILITLYLLFCLLSLIFSKREIRIHELLLFLGTTFMAFLSMRHFSLMVITTVVLLPHFENIYNRLDNSNWSLFKSLKSGFNLMNIIILCFYILMISYFAFDIITRDNNSLPKSDYPVDATNYIKTNLDKNDRIFNQYEWGSYLMFNDIKVFIDPRCDLYNEEYNDGVTVMKDYVDLIHDDKKIDDIVSKYKIDYFMLHKKAKPVSRMLNNSKYSLLYSDEIVVIIKVVK